MRLQECNMFFLSKEKLQAVGNKYVLSDKHPSLSG